MTPALGRLLRCAIAVSVLGIPCKAEAQAKISRLTAADLFGLAERAAASGRTADAFEIYRALGRDPDPEIRAEALFRRGMLLAALKHYAEAATVFRDLLDQKPGAARVELELARVLADMGDDVGARRALRQAQAIGLPREVAIAVDQFVGALRSTKRLGGSFEIAVAPDTNVNRATSARTLDTVIAPLILSNDARERSGIGLKLSGQGFARIAMSKHFSLVPRLSAAASLYRVSQFNDVSGSAMMGFEWSADRDRVTPAIGSTMRWYGGRQYARTQTAAIDWLHPVGRMTEFTVSGSAAHVSYFNNHLQDGRIYDLSVNAEHALGSRTGIGGLIGATRQSARDPGYATRSGYVRVFGWRDFGGMTLFTSAEIRRTEGDARLLLFLDRRREWLYAASLGVAFRKLRYRGFAPLLRLSLERNISTIGLYNYRRLVADFGISRAF